MNRSLRFPALFLFLAGMPAAVAAQSTERSIERLAESIAASAERLAARVERNAALLAGRLEREFARRERSGDWRWDDERESREGWQQATRLDTTITFGADGTIDLTALGGDILVTGWERNEARIQARAERGELEFDLSSSRIAIDVRRDRGYRGSRGRGDTRFELSVPRGVRVIARSSSGDIVVRGTGSTVSVSSTSGDIEVVDATRRVDLSTVSGDVVGKRLRGDIQANSVSGSVELDDVEGEVRLESTSGDLAVTGARARQVMASTTSGEIVFDGVFADDGRYEFHSHSGNVEVSVPASSNVRFSVETYSGELDSDFAITLEPGERATRRPRRFDFTVGSGGPRVTAETFSGNLDIRKK